MGRYETFEHRLRRGLLIRTVERALLQAGFGAVVGAMVGATGGPPGIAVGAVVGGLVGWLAAAVGVQEERRAALRDRRIEI